MNILIDVTSSCRSVQNTGMQRMTRKIFAELSQRMTVTPLCWNQIGRFYQLLGPTERTLLTRPFDVHGRPVAKPQLRGQNPIAEFRRLVALPRFDFAGELRPNDVFLSPDVHADARRKILPRLIDKVPARSVAIFHDAARLRLAPVYGSRGGRYRDYIVSLASFDLVICISQEAHDDLQHYWEQFGCKPTATRIEPWPAAVEQVQTNTGPTAASNVVLCVSSLDPRKNHFTLLSAAEKLWAQGLDFELRLIGRAARLFGRKVAKKVEDLRRRRRAVTWMRHIDDETLLREYRDCRFTVYPSLMEGYGLPIVESLSHGKPCVCGDNGALGETARGGGCLIVDQTNVDALAAGMEKLLTDRETYARLSAETRARTFRSWPDYIKRLLELLAPILITASSLS
jgi:glycosyltransferase involved in cell wall biosynthesis